MEDFVISKCEESDAEEIRDIAKANNYFNPNYKDLKEGGFTGTVFNSDIVKKILRLGHSYKLQYKKEILAYMLGVDELNYKRVFSESLEDLHLSFFGKKCKFPGKAMFFAQAAVRPAFKGRGIARELFSQAKEEWKRKGFNTVYGEIASHNEHSMKFWTLMGLKKIGQRKWPTGIYYKGCDESWLRENYTKLKEKKDERVDEKLLAKLKINLYSHKLN